jgi:single-stranded-DNA-specific exonuclease
LSADDLTGVIYSDGELSDRELTLDTAQLLRDASPWGQGFPAPLFEGDFKVLGYRVVGEKHLKMSLQTAQGRCRIDAIAFNTTQLPSDCRQLHMAYRLDANEFRGIVSPQIIVEHIETM